MSHTITDLNGALAGRYRVERELGEGGMATVYLAADLRHQRKVALKVLKAELAADIGPARFLQEIRVTANLQHPHILPLFDSGETEGLLYYVMPYVDGESLRDRVEREGELPVGEAISMLTQVADALSAAHAMGVVHRDIKPANVLLSGRHAVVGDFGVAKAVSGATGRHRMTTEGVTLGTAPYMAPEQAAADETVDHRADIYAVGALAYELLTGRPPFIGRTAQQVLAAQLTARPRPISELRPAVPDGVDAIVMRCLEKRPADRWQTAAELVVRLEGLAVASSGGTQTAVAPRTMGGGFLRRGRIALAVAVVVGAALWIGLGPMDTDPTSTGPPASSSDGLVQRDRLMVMPLEDLTGDPDVQAWSMLAAEMIGRAIDRPRPIDVVPATVVRDASRLLGPDRTVEEVAERVGATYAVAGTFALSGGDVRFQIEFLDARSGQRLRALEPVVGSADSVETVVGRLASAAAAASVALLDPDSPAWARPYSLPPSVEAYEQYLTGTGLFCRGRYRESIDALDRAVEMAPDFVAPLLMARTAYANLGLAEEADSVTMLIESVRDRLTNAERLEQDAQIADLTGDWALATRAAEEGFRAFPSTHFGFMAGYTALRTRRVDDAIERLRAVDADAPCIREWRPLWYVLTASYHLLGRYEDELSAAREALGRFSGHRYFMDAEARALAGLGRVERVDSVIDAMDQLPPEAGFDPDLRPALAALELEAHGQVEAGRRLLDEALARYRDRPPDQSRYQRGRVLYWAGSWADADTVFSGLLDEAPDNVAYLTLSGAASARLGRVERAEALSARLAALERPGMRGRGTAGRAWIAAALGRWDEALSLLQRAFEEGYPFGLEFHVDPTFDGLRDDPRWAALMAPR